MRILHSICLVSIAALAAVGCGLSESSSAAGLPGGPSGAAGGAGDFGATQGGVQDMTFARDTVRAGRVPPPEAFVVEAMFSEHDLPLEGEPCATLFCLRAATGIAPNESSEGSAWLQVGLSSTVDPATFERPSLSAIAVVDVSGSMGWDYGEQTPGALSQALLAEVAKRLGDADRFAIVTYGSQASVLLPPGPASDQSRITSAIESLSEAGSTNMEAGLQLAYEIAGDELGRADEVRLMLFTDVQPNVGATAASEFERLASAGAERRIGLTVFAVGLGLNPDVVRGMSQIRGANAFSLTRIEQVSALMEDSWPWMVSPIAHDLRLAAMVSEGFVVGRGYGFPESTLDDEASLSVSSIFLSRRKGALLLRIDPEGDQLLSSLTVGVSLEYETLEGERRTESFVKDFSVRTESDPFEQPAVYKTVVLARLVSAMKAAAERYGSEPDEAIAILQRAHAQLEGSLEDLDDPALEQERQLSSDLLELMRGGASQESFYGGF